MHPGRCTLRLALALALAAPALAGCALLDLVRGSNVEDALEHVPASTRLLQFADRAAMAERFGLADIDPRDVSDAELEDYVAAIEGEEAAARTALSDDAEALRDAPFNDFDVEWEAWALWDAEVGGNATIWKVGDDVDFADLGDALEDDGYEPDGRGDREIYVSEGSHRGGLYRSAMADHVLLAEDEGLVVSAGDDESLLDLVDVITDDADSLADDGGMDDLLELGDDDPEVAWLAIDGTLVCRRPPGERLPQRVIERYAGLGRPEDRAFFVSRNDEQSVLLALRYASEADAEADLEARESMVRDGVDPETRERFEKLGDFELERDGDVLLIEQDYEEGAAAAAFAERLGTGPGACLPEQPPLSPRA